MIIQLKPTFPNYVPKTFPRIRERRSGTSLGNVWRSAQFDFGFEVGNLYRAASCPAAGQPRADVISSSYDPAYGR
jgi:hypothetical protein